MFSRKPLQICLKALPPQKKNKFPKRYLSKAQIKNSPEKHRIPIKNPRKNTIKPNKNIKKSHQKSKTRNTTPKPLPNGLRHMGGASNTQQRPLSCSSRRRTSRRWTARRSGRSGASVRAKRGPARESKEASWERVSVLEEVGFLVVFFAKFCFCFKYFLVMHVQVEDLLRFWVKASKTPSGIFAQKS